MEDGGGRWKYRVTPGPLHKEEWHQMKRWYKAVVDCVPPSARINLKWITAERIVLYHQVPPPGEKIPISVEPLKVEDLVHTEDKI